MFNLFLFQSFQTVNSFTNIFNTINLVAEHIPHCNHLHTSSIFIMWEYLTKRFVQVYFAFSVMFWFNVVCHNSSSCLAKFTPCSASRSLAISAYTVYNSIPINRLPVFIHAIPVVPLPANTSTTKSPSFVVSLIILSISFTGTGQG